MPTTAARAPDALLDSLSDRLSRVIHTIERAEFGRDAGQAAPDARREEMSAADAGAVFVFSPDIAFTISGDGLRLAVSLYPSQPPPPALKPQLLSYLRDTVGIQAPIDDAGLDQALADAGRLVATERLVIARGVEPRPATPPRLELALGELLDGVLEACGEVPVRSGCRVAQLIPGRAPAPGIDVLGRPIHPPPPAKPPRIGPGLRVATEGGAVVAAMDGLLRWTPDSLDIEAYQQPARFEVSISANQLVATVAVTPFWGAPCPSITPADVLRELANAGVRHGIDETALAAAAAHATIGCETVNFEVARGTPPQPGVGGRFQLLVGAKREEIVSRDDDGRVDHRRRVEINKVVKGQLLGILTPGQPGQPGITVKGEPLPAPDPRVLLVVAGPNVIASPDGTKFYAAIDGYAAFRKPRLSVHPLYVVEGHVDYATGHIEFSGHVVVTGGVRDGFNIAAGGDVIIQGEVGASHIKAGGAITVKGGVHGQSRGVLEAGESVSAKFIDNARVIAGGDLVVHDSLYNCTVLISGSLRAVTRRGLIVGSSIHAGGAVEARSIGSQQGTQTHIAVGVDAASQRRLAELDKQIEEIASNGAKLDQVLASFRALGADPRALPPERRRLLANAAEKRRALREQLEIARAERRALLHQLQQPSKAYIAVYDEIRPDAHLRIGAARTVIARPLRQALFRQRGNEIAVARIPQR